MSSTEAEGRAESAVEQAREKSGELVSQAQQQVRETTDELRGQAAVRVREQVDERSTQAGEQLRSVGQALQRGSEQLRSEGKDAPARLVDEVARRTDGLAGYLESSDAERILHDVEQFARRRPWLTAAVGVGLGFVASRFLKASSARRYETYGARGYEGGYAMTPTHERDLGYQRELVGGTVR